MNNKTIKYINLVVLFYLLVSFLSAQEPAKSGEIILKDVNAGSKSIETQINLRDAEKVSTMTRDFQINKSMDTVRLVAI